MIVLTPTSDIRPTRYTFEAGARTNWHSHEGGQVITTWLEKVTDRQYAAGAPK